VPDSLLLRCPWTKIHEWTFESETFEGLTPSQDSGNSWELSFVDAPVVGKALHIYLRHYDLGGTFTAPLDTLLYSEIAKAYKIEFWYWTDDATNGFYRPSVAVDCITSGVPAMGFSDLYNVSLVGISRSAGTWYRVVGMMWVGLNRTEAFVYNAAGTLLGHFSGNYQRYGLPTSLRITTTRRQYSEYRHNIRFSNISISYTPSLPPDPSLRLRRRRAAWMDMDRPLI